MKPQGQPLWKICRVEAEAPGGCSVLLSEPAGRCVPSTQLRWDPGIALLLAAAYAIFMHPDAREHPNASSARRSGALLGYFAAWVSFPPAPGSVQVWSATWGWDKLPGWWLCLRTPCYHLHLLPPGMPRVGTSAGFRCVISLCRSSECREVSVQIGSDGSHLHKVLPFSTEIPVQWLKSRCPWLYWAACHSPGPWALGTASPRL